MTAHGLMAHFDEVLPGRVHHIQYETLVENTEAEIRRLIDYCGLPFEEDCLRYWETERAIQTPSSEQVRKPIFKGAVEQWQNYHVAPEGVGYIPRLAKVVHDPGSGLPDLARDICRMVLE